MAKHKKLSRTALLPHAVEKVFAVVDDVVAYPQFLKWCQAAAVVEPEETQLPAVTKASLTLKAKGVRHELTTCNTAEFPHRITMELETGPLEYLTGQWTFSALDDGAACKVELDLEFALSGALSWLGVAADKMIGRVADELVDAFCLRVDALNP